MQWAARRHAAAHLYLVNDEEAGWKEERERKRDHGPSTCMHELSVVCIGAARRGELRVKRSPLSQAARFKFQQTSTAVSILAVCAVWELADPPEPPPRAPLLHQRT